MELESKHIIPCIKPGLSCCQYRLVATGVRADDNVFRVPVWCMKWRLNRMKDKLFHGCDEHYLMPEEREHDKTSGTGNG